MKLSINGKISNTTFLLNGGAGRIVAAIPALERYHAEYPDDDFKIIVQGWSDIYHNHPILHKKTYNYADRGIFDLFVKNSYIHYPEPYFNRGYYNQELHMVDAFYREIVGNSGVILDQIYDPFLYTSKQEDNQIRSMLSQITKETKKKNIVVFQPYGSSMALNGSEKPHDPTYRSFDVDDALKIISILSEKYTVIYFGPDEFRHPGDSYSVNISNIKNRNIRFYMNLIKNCDYFIGCDSVGNHVANAFGKSNAIVLGSTFPENVAYPNSVIFRSENIPTYSPIRICEGTYEDQSNSRCMEFPEETLEIIAKTPDTVI